MWVGDVLAERFALERQIGGGGMGTVFLAKDRATGAPVAVKAIDATSEGAVERFRREARVLSELSHPGIVRYITHGESDDDEPFLVMEWLEGEDLAQILCRGGLSTAAGLRIVRRAAEALAFAHSKGVVHRDIKPSNLFLVGGDPERVKVLDFGIAKPQSRSRDLTGSSTLLGTFGYMAPEQVVGSALVDTRADVFSLGCVLFECLTGQPAFAAEHAVAVLAKLLAVEAPRASSLRPDLGSAVDDLLARMLAKEPDRRFRDGGAVAEAIAAIRLDTSASMPGIDSTRTTITDSERKGVTVLLSEPRSVELARTTTPTETDADFVQIAHIAAQFGTGAQPLPGGAFLIVLSEGVTATDRATHAAMLALKLVGLRSDIRIALATGQTETRGSIPMGPVIDCAAKLLRLLVVEGSESERRIAVDSATVGLLGSRFMVSAHESFYILAGERTDLEGPRLLLGKRTPCVGREKEIGLLEATLREVTEDSVARAVLVTAPPGMGKSRLLTEFISRVRSSDGLRILVASADSVAPGSPLSMIRQIVRRAGGLVDSDPEAVQRERLERYRAEIVASGSGDGPFEFIRELVGLPLLGSPPPLLVAARNDPAIMREQARRAFDWWIGTELQRGSLLIVLEDLHWGDPGTVKYLDRALRNHAGMSLMILASARPEVHDVFSKLFPELQEIHLTGLAPRAAERLVRAILGSGVSDNTVGRIVQRADGNAFYLEELIRRAAEGDDSLPDTIIAMVQSRLARLEPEARRVLRAASVFGDTCWVGGVGAVLGPPIDARGWLEALSDRELLVRRGQSRFPEESEFAFRHNLLRDAAYTMLTDEDRVAAHHAAGDWLEHAGEPDSRVLAQHFEQGRDAQRAVPWIVKAAVAAAWAGTLEPALETAVHGLDLGAVGEHRGALLGIRALATYSMTADYSAAFEMSREALTLVAEGSQAWWSGLSSAIWCAVAAGHPAEAGPYIQLLFQARTVERTGPYGAAIYGALTGLPAMGQIDLCRTFLERIEASGALPRAKDPLFDAWFGAIRCQFAGYKPQRDPWKLENALVWGKESAKFFSDAGLAVGELCALVNLAIAQFWLGDLEGAEASLRRVLLLAHGSGYFFLRQVGEYLLSVVEIRRGRVREALGRVEPLATSGDTIVTQLARCVATDAHSRLGQFDEALAHASVALDSPAPFVRRWGGLVAAAALCGLGRFRDALEAIDRAITEPALGPGDVEEMLLVVRAGCLRLLGDEAGSNATIRQARDMVLESAKAIADPALRRSFLTNVEGNATALALAQDWLGEDA